MSEQNVRPILNPGDRRFKEELVRALVVLSCASECELATIEGPEFNTMAAPSQEERNWARRYVSNALKELRRA